MSTQEESAERVVHTPGPWGLPSEASENVFGDDISIDVLDSDGFPIADVHHEPILHRWHEKYPRMRHWADGAADGRTQRIRDEREVLANARLIAAAPDLLDAAYKLDTFLAHTKPVGHVRMRDWLSAVISKAEGS